MVPPSPDLIRRKSVIFPLQKQLRAQERHPAILGGLSFVAFSLTRRFRSSSSSQRSRSSGRHSHRSHAPSRSSHLSGGSSRSPPPMLSRHSSVVPLTHVSRRATPSATIRRALPSPPPTWSRHWPRCLLPFWLRFARSSPVTTAFPLMTPPPRYVSQSPRPAVMGPPSAPRPSSQSTDILSHGIQIMGRCWLTWMHT